MKKIKILIPVYNDWESLIKLLDEINKVIEDIKSFEFDCMIVNDASTDKPPDIKVPKNLTNFHKSYDFFHSFSLEKCLLFLINIKLPAAQGKIA